MKNESGKHPGPLPHFAPVMDEWIKANQRYRSFSGGNDIPWGYNERASLSALAAAFWLAKGVALEEYVETKNVRDSRKRKADLSRGRCDLYVSLRRKEYILEAKIVWPSLATKSWEKAIMPWLKEAQDDVRHTLAHNREKKLGLLFVVPYPMSLGIDDNQ